MSRVDFGAEMYMSFAYMNKCHSRLGQHIMPVISLTGGRTLVKLPLRALNSPCIKDGPCEHKAVHSEQGMLAMSLKPRLTLFTRSNRGSGPLGATMSRIRERFDAPDSNASALKPLHQGCECSDPQCTKCVCVHRNSVSGRSIWPAVHVLPAH